MLSLTYSQYKFRLYFLSKSPSLLLKKKKHPTQTKAHKNIWMEYSFFHKNDFLFSTNHIKFTGSPVGIAGLKKKNQWANAWPLPNSMLYKSERSPSHKFSKISAGGESRNPMWYQSFCQRHLAVPSPCLLALARTCSFEG